jgi:hypothetical protein
MSFSIKQSGFRKEADMIMQIIKFRSTLSLDEVQKIAQERKEEFLAVSGLVQKYYFKSIEVLEVAFTLRE